MREALALTVTIELRRSFGLLGIVGFSFSIVTRCAHVFSERSCCPFSSARTKSDTVHYSWSALAGVMVVGIDAGGPPVMVYSWIAVCLITLTVAYSLAEMCSAYPVSGGQYSWVVLLAPPKIARGMSWVTGWFMITGIIAMGTPRSCRPPEECYLTLSTLLGATVNFLAANLILGMANLANPEFVIEQWHTVLVTYAVALVTTSINVFVPRFLSKISTAALCWNITTFFVVIITILTTNKQKQPSSFVWKVRTTAALLCMNPMGS